VFSLSPLPFTTASGIMRHLEVHHLLCSPFFQRLLASSVYVRFYPHHRLASPFLPPKAFLFPSCFSLPLLCVLIVCKCQSHILLVAAVFVVFLLFALLCLLPWISSQRAVFSLPVFPFTCLLQGFPSFLGALDWVVVLLTCRVLEGTNAGGRNRPRESSETSCPLRCFFCRSFPFTPSKAGCASLCVPLHVECIQSSIYLRFPSFPAQSVEGMVLNTAIEFLYIPLEQTDFWSKTEQLSNIS
jgi:hypothetical protein